MPYDIYTKLFDSMVWPVIAYGAAVWGTRQFSCIDAVQLKAQRYLLGTGKYTPSAAVAGDMGWIPTFIKQYKCICNQWTRYVNMPDNRVNKRIFNFCKSKSGARCQNWYFRVSKHFCCANCSDFIILYFCFQTRRWLENVPKPAGWFYSVGQLYCIKYFFF